MKKYEQKKIPLDFDYTIVKGLSAELLDKLTQAQPETLAAASKIQGMTPAALNLLLAYLSRVSHENAELKND